MLGRNNTHTHILSRSNNSFLIKKHLPNMICLYYDHFEKSLHECLLSGGLSQHEDNPDKLTNPDLRKARFDLLYKEYEVTLHVI